MDESDGYKIEKSEKKSVENFDFNIVVGLLIVVGYVVCNILLYRVFGIWGLVTFGVILILAYYYSKS